MSETMFTTRLVNLEKGDLEIVYRCARERGMDQRGFSAAIRSIIREWAHLQPLVNSMPAEVRSLLADWSAINRSTISPEDALLEAGGIDVEYPAGGGLPSLVSQPRPPKDEYEAGMNKVRGGKYSG